MDTTCLYVGNLHPGVTEHMLYEQFSTVGPIRSIQVCRDNITHQSLGYAYVNFVERNNLSTAIEIKNFDKINGQSIRVMWAQRDRYLLRKNENKQSTEKAQPFTNVYVKNFDDGLTEVAIQQIFEKVGPIKKVTIIRDIHGKSRGFGFVAFEHPQSATNAIIKFNGKEVFEKKPLYVGRAQLRLENINRYKDCNLYVFGLSPAIDDYKLYELFTRFGTIISANIMKRMGESLGYGFVCFTSPENAMNAISEMNGHIIGTRPIYVALAQQDEHKMQALLHDKEPQIEKYNQQCQERINRMRDSNLYVTNINHLIDNKQLYKLFSPYGNIISAVVMRQHGKSMGSGFVCYSSPIEASKAIIEMNGRLIKTRVLNVTLARPKDEPKTHVPSKSVEPIASMSLQHQIEPQKQPCDSSCRELVPIFPQQPLTASMLEAMSLQEQDQVLWDRLFLQIKIMHPDLAEKITDVIIDTETEELLYMLEHNEILKTKVDEVVAVLQADQTEETVQYA